MSTNPLKSSLKDSGAMTADRARQMAEWARQDGKGDLASAWRKYADELDGIPAPIDGKMKAAGQ